MLRYITTNFWNPTFYLESSFFKPFTTYAQNFSHFKEWPSIFELAEIVQSYNIYNRKNILLKPFNQDNFDQLDNLLDYESLVYQQGILLTRPKNWHDFLNILVWLGFPKLKGLINALHYSENQKKYKNNRTPLQNKLTQFDESGLIILTSQSDLIELIYQHRWQAFFCQQKSNVNKNLKCFAFGHSILERLLNPYVGLTAKALIFKVDSEILKLPTIEALSHIDLLCCGYLEQNKMQFQHNKLQPFPLLGMTEIIEKNNDDYIQYKNYFRPLPKCQK